MAVICRGSTHVIDCEIAGYKLVLRQENQCTCRNALDKKMINGRTALIVSESVRSS